MNIAIIKRGLVVAVLLGSFAPIACSSDTGEKGASGAGGKPATDGAGGMPAGTVACGTKFCATPEGSTAAPCCIAPFESKCGIMGPLGCTTAPPPPPKDCPPLPSLGGFFQLMGCCTAAGECGVDWSVISMGCLNYADSQSRLMMFMQMRPPGAGRDGGIPGFGGMGGLNLNVTLPAEAACTPPAPM